eukprot:scaffold242923_cov16-Tisochrysis_lutea.AAC.1
MPVCNVLGGFGRRTLKQLLDLRPGRDRVLLPQIPFLQTVCKAVGPGFVDGLLEAFLACDALYRKLCVLYAAA